MIRRIVAILASVGLGLASACTALKSADSSANGPEGGPGATMPEPSADAGTPSNRGTTPGESGAEAGPSGSPCSQANCQVEVVAKGLYGPVTIAVDDRHLYWIEVGQVPPSSFGQLVRIRKDGGCVARSCFDVLDYRVADGQLSGRLIYETHIAVGASDVCYTQTYNANPEHDIWCFALGDPSLRKRALDRSAGAVFSLWVGGSEARWALETSNTGGDGAVWGRALAGGAARNLASNRFGLSAVTSDGRESYWSETGAAAGKGGISAALPDGGTRSVALDRSAPYGLKVYKEYLYWIEGSRRTVMRARADGTDAPTQIATTDVNPVELAVDATGVYWIAAGEGGNRIEGSLSHAPLSPGGITTVMLKGLNMVYALAVDATHVYTASVGQLITDGEIVRIRKTGR